MSKETPQKHSRLPIPAQRIRWASVLARKSLFALLAVSVLIVLIAAVHPSIIKAARASLGRIIYAKTSPTAALLESATSEMPSSSSALSQQQKVPAEAQAQKIWTEFEKSVWGAPLQDWSSLHADVPCQPFHGNMWGGGADRQWSHRCSTGGEREAPHWYFYVFSLQEPLISRLEQFDMSTSALSEETLASVQNVLKTRLSNSYGIPEDRSPKIARARAVLWPEDLQWKAADLEIQLNVSEFDPQRKEGRLRLQARHRALLEALNDDQRLKLVGASDFLYQTDSGIDKQLADALRSDFSDVATMLVKDQPDPDPQKMREALQQAIQQRQNQLKSSRTSEQTGGRAVAVFAFAAPQTIWKAEEFYDALMRLLTNAKTSAPDRQPILLLAADRLAYRLPWVIAKDKSREWNWSEWREQLATFGVTYEKGFSQPPEYAGDLLKRVWTDHGETDWGERAFLLLLSHGWDTSTDCRAGSDQFRQVIQQALPFLEKHTKSPYQLDVQLDVAEAYETWWSLSQAREIGQNQGEEAEGEGLDANPQEYQEGAETARQQAIARYEQLLQTAPQSDYGAYAKRVLPRLKLGIDTGQRRFYCTIGD